MIPRRGGTPLRVGAPSLEASNQAQIDDLVQRNRTLEHTVKKLSDQATLEVKRSKEAVATIREQWLHQQQEWREGCDVLQSCHRIVQLRNVVELENERQNALKELNAVRKEKLKRLQRDFRITMFQVKEAELERRIQELENESQSMSIEYEERIRRLKAASAEYAAQAKAKDDELAVAEQEKEELEVSYFFV
jgi:vacuolar-type H+-ATPase catalytic subunit A/Vma1